MSLDRATMDERVPRDFETLRATILDRRESLPKRIAQIAAYALDNPDDIAFGTAASIAASAGVQPSTLIRFAQQLGFDGFTSLQQVFRERLRERNSSYDERLLALRAKAEGGAGHRAIFDGFVAASSTSLNEFHARSTIASRRRNWPAGKGRNHLCAGQAPLLSGALLHRLCAGQAEDPQPADRIGRRAQCRDDRLCHPAGRRHRHQLLAYAPATIEEARIISEQGVPIVAITDSSFSPLAQFAKVWFEVAEADFAGFRSLSATMALAMALTVAVGEKRRDTGKKRKA